MELDVSNKVIKLSQIFKWYPEDFILFQQGMRSTTESQHAIVEKETANHLEAFLVFIKYYANNSLAVTIEEIMRMDVADWTIEDFPYDWKLNINE